MMFKSTLILALTASLHSFAMDPSTKPDAPVTATNNPFNTLVKTNKSLANTATTQMLQDRSEKFICRRPWQIFKKCERKKELLKSIDETSKHNTKDLSKLIGQYRAVTNTIDASIREVNDHMGWDKSLFGSENFPKYDPRKTNEKPSEWYKKLSPQIIAIIARNIGVPEDTEC